MHGLRFRCLHFFPMFFRIRLFVCFHFCVFSFSCSGSRHNRHIRVSFVCAVFVVIIVGIVLVNLIVILFFFVGLESGMSNSTE